MAHKKMIYCIKCRKCWRQIEYPTHNCKPVQVLTIHEAERNYAKEHIKPPLPTNSP